MDLYGAGSINELHATSREYCRNYIRATPLIANNNEHRLDIPSSTIFVSPETSKAYEDEHGNTIPSIAQCAVHLELLECFKILQETVIKSNQLDVLFDTLPRKKFTVSYIRNSSGRRVLRRTLLKPTKAHDSTYQERRKGKWKIFVDYAYSRFLTWVISIHTHWEISGNDGDQFDPKLVPPIDVLLIWHAFLLKPRLCLEWCLRQRVLWVSRLDLPWEHIHLMINQFNRSFELPLENADAFKRMTKLEPDLLQCLIEDPKDGLTSGDRALRVQPATPKNPQATDAEFDKIWQNYDVWVDVMCHFLWIRSPALEFTLRRARDRYRQFFQLLATNPTPSLAPTPDVELVWLTHQSSPLSFELFSKFSVGRLVEHNAVPHDHSYQQALLSTEQAFRAYFGTAYRQCLCWDCQNLQRVAEQSLSEIEGTQQLVQKSMRQVAYHRAVEHARRDRRILPVAQ